MTCQPVMGLRNAMLEDASYTAILYIVHGKDYARSATFMPSNGTLFCCTRHGDTQGLPNREA